jgi:hypothetical protein
MTVRDIVQAAAGVGGGGEGAYIEDVFSTYLYQNNDSTQTITNGIDLDGEGGLVWIKWRNQGASHALTDTERGAGQKLIYTDLTNGENAFSQEAVSSFLSDGFVASGTYNQGSFLSASWTFRKAPKFFDIVTYTGTGSARTVSHNLGSVPGCIMVKRTDTTGAWQVYHRANTANPETDYLVLNTTAATADSNTRWNDTQPTDAVFSLGTEATVNASGGTYVAYLFAHDAGGFGDDGSENVISCGSLTGTGSAQTITLGWEPQWLLFKRTDSGGSWFMIDTMRGWTTAGDAAYLQAQSSVAETALTALGISLTATGLSVTATAGHTFIYIAIRRGPMKTPTSGTEVFTPIAYTGSGASQVVSTAFPSDTVMHKSRTSSDTYDGDIFVHDRLRGVKISTQILRTTKTNAESGNTSYWIWEMNNDNLKWATLADEATGNLSPKTYILYNFRRAPGFFDVVCYTGTGSATTIAHNLNVVPELIIVKNRSASDAWQVYAGDATDYLVLNTNAATADNVDRWNDTAPTA